MGHHSRTANLIASQGIFKFVVADFLLLIGKLETEELETRNPDFGVRAPP
jgi:hypothetical protein